MKYLSLVWAQLFRSKTRTLLTLFSVIVAFLLFGLLDSVRVAFTSGGSVKAPTAWWWPRGCPSPSPCRCAWSRRSAPSPACRTSPTRCGSAASIVIRRISSRTSRSRRISSTCTPSTRCRRTSSRRSQNTRTGAAVGEALAKKFGWKVGDTIPLQATIFPRGGSNDWPLELKLIFRAKDRANVNAENQLMMNWKYFDESNDYIKSQVSWYTVKLTNADQASRVAQAIDALSANSDHETKTQTESAFQQAFIKQFADIGMIVTAIMGAVFFTLLLLTGNTMAQAVRERIPELATLKTLGFQDSTVLTLVMIESVLLVMLGGLLGRGLASAAIPGLAKASGGALPVHMVPLQTWLLGLALMIDIGVVVGLLPALRARRLKIVDALAGR